MAPVGKLLQERNCHLRDRVQDWKKAIHIARKPLIEQNYYTTIYEATTYEITERLGPYYVFYENLALIHTSNQSGVNDTQTAVTILKEPMKFEPDRYDVRMLVALTAKNSESYMEGIQAVSNIFSDKRKAQEILDAACPEGMFDLFVPNACEKWR